MAGNKESWKAGDRVILRGTIAEADRPGYVKVSLDYPARGAHADVYVMTKGLRRSPVQDIAAVDDDDEAVPSASA